MNIINDIIIGMIIFLIYLSVRTSLKHHGTGGVIIGIFLILTGYFLYTINTIYSEITALAGFLIIIISILEREKKEEEEI